MSTIASEAPRQATAVPTSAPSRVERYRAKLDAALADMDPATHLPELVEERARWIVCYDCFTDRVDAGEVAHWGETVWDYLDVIWLLDQRIRDLRGAA